MRFGWELAAVAAFGLAACASTTLRDSWADPAARAEPFRKVLVASVGGGIAQRRLFEDALVAPATGRRSSLPSWVRRSSITSPERRAAAIHGASPCAAGSTIASRTRPIS